MRRALLIAALITTAGNAQAGDWQFVGKNENVAVAVDYATLRSAGSLRTGWFVTGLKDRVTDVPYPYDYSMSRQQYDCSSETVRTLNMVQYTFDSPSPVYSNMDPQPLQPVIPDTLGAGALNLVCGPVPSDPAQLSAQGVADALRKLITSGE